jgi:hypothetical protein
MFMLRKTTLTYNINRMSRLSCFFPPVSNRYSVFASRLGTSSPVWNRFLKRWVWRRYAVATTPKLPHWRKGQRLRIPWPIRQKVIYPNRMFAFPGPSLMD